VDRASLRRCTQIPPSPRFSRRVTPSKRTKTVIGNDWGGILGGSARVRSWREASVGQGDVGSSMAAHWRVWLAVHLLRPQGRLEGCREQLGGCLDRVGLLSA
jgi:hypothetical protein